jgi:hypothetical protein
MKSTSFESEKREGVLSDRADRRGTLRRRQAAREFGSKCIYMRNRESRAVSGFPNFPNAG